MSGQALPPIFVDVKRLNASGTPLDGAWDETARDAVANQFGIDAVERFAYRLMATPDGQGGFLLDGVLRATVVQPCVVSLEPVTTDLDVAVGQTFVAAGRSASRHRRPEDMADPVEIDPESDDPEPFEGPRCDVAPFLVECLSLSIPDYPRASNMGTAKPEPEVEDEDEPLSPLAQQLKKLKDAGKL